MKPLKLLPINPYHDSWYELMNMNKSRKYAQSYWL